MLGDVLYRACAFGCPSAADRLEHYSVCSTVWRFVATPCPAVLGLSLGCRTLQHSLLLRFASENVKIKFAIGIYAVAKTFTQLAALNGRVQIDTPKLFKMHATAATGGTLSYQT